MIPLFQRTTYFAHKASVGGAVETPGREASWNTEEWSKG